MEFEIIKGGPVVPTGVNQKSFNSIKVGAGDTKVFKTGDVLKMTAGKLHLRNDSEKTFNDGNSQFAEKGDIVQINGAVFGKNEERDDHVAIRKELDHSRRRNVHHWKNPSSLLILEYLFLLFSSTLVALQNLQILTK